MQKGTEEVVVVALRQCEDLVEIEYTIEDLSGTGIAEHEIYLKANRSFAAAGPF
jgi:hypothetical protein